MFISIVLKLGWRPPTHFLGGGGGGRVVVRGEGLLWTFIKGSGRITDICFSRIDKAPKP